MEMPSPSDRGCVVLGLPIHFPYSFPDHLERQWWVTPARSGLPCAGTDSVFQSDFNMLHWISVNKFVYEPGKPREQFKTMLKEIYSQSAYHMSGSPIYCSHSWLPSLHLILISWGHVSQKYFPLYSGLFCRENDLKKGVYRCLLFSQWPFQLWIALSLFLCCCYPAM